MSAVLYDSNAVRRPISDHLKFVKLSVFSMISGSTVVEINSI